jgi:hypothetical protein
MKSENIPIWRIILHIFGYHWWATFNPPNNPEFTYRSCEICGRGEEIE